MPRRTEVEAPPPKQFVVGNHRARKRQARMGQLSVMFVYACSPESNMGRVCQGLGTPRVRLAKEFIDLSADDGEIQTGAVRGLREAQPVGRNSLYIRISMATP